MTWKRIPEVSLQEKRIYSESVCDGGLQMLSNRHDSTPIERLVTKKWRPVIPDVNLQDTANRHPVWRIVICCDESFDSSPTVSNRQHLLRCIVYNILTIDFRSFHALRTWKVHVVMFSYHATHFHSLLTCTCAPLDFRYVNARFDFWHTMVISNIAYASRLPVYERTIRHPVWLFINDRGRIATVWVYWTYMLTCAPLDFRYVNARFDIRCDDSWTTVDESQRFGWIGHIWNRKMTTLLIKGSKISVTSDLPSEGGFVEGGEISYKKRSA